VSDADRLARLERAAARCLELLDEGRPAEARRELAGLIHAPPASEPLALPVSDLELDCAFERAEPVADEVIDADRVAQQAIREVDRELARRPTPPFATRTMAELLEQQGDAEGARRIRDSLAARDPRREARAAGRGRADRSQALSTLERWLTNVRGGHGA